eukprot:5156582-Pyramimonas_sp.AAC.1
MTAAEYTHHFGRILTDEACVRQVQEAVRRSREEHPPAGRDPTAGSSTTPLPMHDEALSPVEPPTPHAQDEVPDSSSSDGDFDRLMAEHGFGAIYPNGTVGGALASASGETSGAEGHPTHA